MASLNTNAAAITALRTLQTTNASLDKTQNVISTGYKIGEAKDNAAYWAISTTLKSDNKSLSTVKDALGLGASTVDTAYQGLNKAKDVLDEIKSKLTAATQDGVDRDTIQAEIKQLQEQLKSIATSSVFSGENWLSTDTSAVSYNANKTVVSSFSRDSGGAVSIGTIGVDISKVALFDASTTAGTGGIIDGAVNLKGKDGRDLTIGGTDVTTGTPTLGGLTGTGATAQQGAAALATPGTAVTATSLGATAGPGTPSSRTYGVAGSAGIAVTGTYANGDTIVLTFSTGTATLTAAAGNLTELNSGTVSWATLAGATVGGGGTFTLSAAAGGGLTVTSATNGTMPATYTSIAATTANGGDTESATLANTVTTSAAGSPAVASSTAATVKSAALTVGDFAVGDKVSITLDDGSGTPKTFTTAALTAAGGGAIALTDIRDALNAVTGFSSTATASITGGNELKLDAAAAGAKSVFSLTKLTAVGSNGDAKTVTNGIGTEATAAKKESGTFSAITLDADDNLYFKVQVDDATAATNVTINKELIDKALKDVPNHVSGNIATVGEYKTVLEAALKAVNLDSKVAVSVTSASTKITLASKTVGTDSKLAITETLASKGGDKVSIENMDISAAGFAKLNVSSSDDVKKVLTAYIDAVNTAITKVTSAASSLGSVASRIDLQKSFVDTLMDTIDKGVGNLIDADMSEESTKLQALQVKQQLGVQALSIANQASQSILSLFRG